MKSLFISIFVIVLSSIFIQACVDETREEVLERYPSGAKYVVGVYKGTGSNEILLQRQYYRENGVLGRINDLKADRIINYKEINPEVLTSEGLKFFLEGTWSSVKKVKHERYDVYELSSAIFSEKEVERNIASIICEGDNRTGIIIGAGFTSNIQYKDDLEIDERIIHFNRWMYISEWNRYLNMYDLDFSSFTMSAYHTIGENQHLIDEAYSELDNPSRRFNKFTTLIGSISIDRIYIFDTSIGDTIELDLIYDITGDSKHIDNYFELFWDDGLNINNGLYTRGSYRHDCNWLKKNSAN